MKEAKERVNKECLSFGQYNAEGKSKGKWDILDFRVSVTVTTLLDMVRYVHTSTRYKLELPNKT